MSDWHNIHTVKVQYEEVALEENANDIRSSFNFSSKLKGKICILIGSQILCAIYSFIQQILNKKQLCTQAVSGILGNIKDEGNIPTDTKELSPTNIK